jgi:hypothetical protein
VTDFGNCGSRFAGLCIVDRSARAWRDLRIRGRTCLLNTVRAQATGLTKDQRNAFFAACLGWAMDAFDYFLVVLVHSEIADDFGVSLTDMAFLTTATLVMRPVGALIFGMWADRRGRRVPLVVDVAFYSVVGFACAFAPNYAVLLVLRLLHGIGMGGEWGLGAALAMEKFAVTTDDPSHRTKHHIGRRVTSVCHCLPWDPGPYSPPASASPSAPFGLPTG